MRGLWLQQLRLEKESWAVYLLVRRGEVVYVGMTSNIVRRTASHTVDKLFDEVWYVLVPMDMVPVEVEENLIKLYQPEYNITGLRKARRTKAQREAERWRQGAAWRLSSWWQPRGWLARTPS